MKIAVVGTGMISSEVLPTIKALGIEVVALCATPDTMDICNEWCKNYEIPAAYADYSTMLQEVKADAVYLGIPNILHYPFSKQALEAGWNVIVEKPFTTNTREAEALAALAKEKGRFIFEAITTRYLPNYQRIREWLPRIGTVKLINCNFSQYSSRYKAFQNGVIAPVFDPKKCGGVLLDLNIYNVHWITGLFGAPKDVRYQANMDKGVDTSGVLTMEYDGFQAVSMAAKDCNAPCYYTIQGTEGYILQTAPANGCLSVELHLNDGTVESFHKEITRENYLSRLVPEFQYFEKQIGGGDTTECYQQLERSLVAVNVLTEARRQAGIIFPTDKD